MEKKEYILLVTEDGKRKGKEIASRIVNCDFLPQIGETIIVNRGKSTCSGIVTEIAHQIGEAPGEVLYVVCKLVGAATV